ncbi:hypothetical protein [Spirulina subsalsa]|uniref:hypothetical protein n=1 Tax=Spirulina subsalsa TaxID=54311 RepID=UPI0003134418|nr:hypothetical protein [Spirulina subsalsa]
MSKQALTRNPLFPPTQVLGQLKSGQLFYVQATPGNALIICHTHYAEIVGPGAMVGGIVDLDCSRLVPLGKVALTYLESFEQKKDAFLHRQQWLSATQKVVKQGVPLKRASLILAMMERYFGATITDGLEDELLASLVGVLPSTMELARQYRRSKQQENSEANMGEDPGKSMALESTPPLSS